MPHLAIILLAVESVSVTAMLRQDTEWSVFISDLSLLVRGPLPQWSPFHMSPG
jgi:hypothetical protein